MGKKFNIRRSLIFNDIYSRLKNIALSIYKWEGLPETCNELFLENTLFHNGQAVFVNDKNLGFLNLKANPSGDLNVYNEPIRYTAYSTGYSEEFNADECVIVFNNRIKKSTDSTLVIFAERLARIQLAIQINIEAQKTPILLRCDKKTELSLKTIYEQYEGDKPAIVTSKTMQNNPIEAITTGAPFVADKLREEFRNTWNEALEFLGLNTNPSDRKKERVIVAEVNSNNEQIDIQALTGLSCRLKACEDFKRVFGKEISVSQRVDDLKNLWIPESNFQSEREGA